MKNPTVRHSSGRADADVLTADTPWSLKPRSTIRAAIFVKGLGKMALTSELTTFTLDNLGRGLATMLDKVLHSAGIDVGLGPPPSDARPFDVVVLGGGTFGSVLAQHLSFVDRTNGWYDYEIRLDGST